MPNPPAQAPVFCYLTLSWPSSHLAAGLLSKHLPLKLQLTLPFLAVLLDAAVKSKTDK
jgi:hypothetical protein